MGRLTDLKTFFKQRIAMTEYIHYVKDLRSPAVFFGPEDKPLSGDFTFEYRSSVSPDHAREFGIRPEQLRNKDIRYVLAIYKKTEPAGCILVNLNGCGTIYYPFRFEANFGKDHSYLQNLYVIPKFRNRGISKYIYNEAFKVLKDDFRYVDAFVAARKLIPNSVIKKMGLVEKERVVFLKLFSLTYVFKLDNALKIAMYDTFFYVADRSLELAGILSRPLVAVLKRIDGFISDLFMKVHILNDSGVAASTGVRVAFACTGTPDRSVLNVIYPNGYTVESKRRFIRKNAARAIRGISASVDLIIVEGSLRWLRKKFPVAEDVKYLPRWVAQRNCRFASFHDFKKTSSRHKNRTAYDDIKKMESLNYTSVFTRDSILVNFFYDNMYLPHIAMRYKDEAIPRSYDFVKKSCKRGGLLLIADGDKYISGAVIEMKNSTLSSAAFGVLNGDADLMRKGALVALYRAYFEMAERSGIRNVDLGLSASFLKDGVLRYKSKWECDIDFDESRSTVFALKLVNLSGPLRSFLIHNPFITIDGQGLTGNIFIDSRMVADREEAVRKNRIHGLSEYKVIEL